MVIAMNPVVCGCESMITCMLGMSSVFIARHLYNNTQIPVETSLTYGVATSAITIQNRYIVFLVSNSRLGQNHAFQNISVIMRVFGFVFDCLISGYLLNNYTNHVIPMKYRWDCVRAFYLQNFAIVGLARLYS